MLIINTLDKVDDIIYTIEITKYKWNIINFKNR